MSPSLKAVLAVFAGYALIGLIPLWASYKSQSRWERLFSGFVLIYISAFVLTGVGLVTGLADQIAHTDKIMSTDRDQLKEFMQYILFFGALFTLFYGAVGANVFTSALIHGDNAEILEALRRIEGKVDQANRSLIELKRGRVAVINLVIIAVGLCILAWLR